MKRKNEELLLFIFTISVYCLLCFYLPYKYPELPGSLTEEIEFVIPSGVSAKAAAEIIKEAGVVDDSAALVREMVNSGLDRRIRPGRYRLRRSTPGCVVRQMEQARPESERVTLIPGSRYKRLTSLFEKEGLSAADFEKALADDNNFYHKARGWLPARTEDRMIFLLPETYFLPPGAGADEFVKGASRLWYERVGAAIAPETPPDEVVRRGVLASVVEGEARVAEERPLLAGIFLSRIEKSMRLQSCATVIYSWEEKNIKKKSLTYRDLEIDSPYNTYLNDGLPPGPICVPSESSWKSALAPEKSDYLFFFANGEGRHIFSESYDEHIAKQRKMGL
ncbi:MAG: endolytic transglycosylase MltG [Synergistaceae bacterium]|nr:endolytic transglycosylase MltG [Synergistaceae bacterium]